MRTKILLVAVVAVVGFIAASFATAKSPPRTTYKLKASLNVGQETSHPKGTRLGASGRFTATLNGTALTWRLTFTHLSGAATMAHIHTAPRGKPGPITVTLCAPCTSPVTGGPSTLTADQIKDLLAGRDYVNVHTPRNPGGEIRGQITKAPTHS